MGLIWGNEFTALVQTTDFTEQWDGLGSPYPLSSLHTLQRVGTVCCTEIDRGLGVPEPSLHLWNVWPG